MRETLKGCVRVGLFDGLTLLIYLGIYLLRVLTIWYLLLFVEGERGAGIVGRGKEEMDGVEGTCLYVMYVV